MGDKALSTELKAKKKELSKLRYKLLSESTKEQSLRSKEATAKRMYDRAIKRCKIKRTKYAEEYKADLPKRRDVYYSLNRQHTDQKYITDKLSKEFDELSKFIEDLEYRYNNRDQIAYANKCSRVVKECVEVNETTNEIKPACDEYVFKTMPATYENTVKTEGGEYTKHTYYDYKICWFLDSVWRICHQVEFHAAQFDWKLCTGIYYNYGSLYIKIKLPVGEHNVRTLKSAGEANTCINLDIDWDMIEEADVVPDNSVVLFDVEKDKQLRIKLNEKWLKRTPAAISYKDYLKREEASVMRMMRRAKQRKQRKSHAHKGA